jgi:hypothetical protein
MQISITDAANNVLDHFITPDRPNDTPSITGVGVGVAPPDVPKVGSRRRPAKKQVAHEPPAIFVFVADLATCELDSIWREANQQAQGYNVVLLRTGNFTGAGRECSISPLAPFQFNVPPVLAGTFGLLVKVGNKGYILSSNHVLAFNGRVPPASPVVNAGTLDDANGTIIGTRSEFVELTPAPWPSWRGTPNTVDCALAETTKSMGLSAMSRPVPVATIQPGTPIDVKKNGRSTGMTYGTLFLSYVQVPIFMSFGVFYFEKMLGVIGKGSQPFAACGDSGSAVLTDPLGEGVGLVTARAYCSGAYLPSGAPPLPPTLQNLRGYIVLCCSLDLVQSEIARRLGVLQNDVQFRGS